MIFSLFMAISFFPPTTALDFDSNTIQRKLNAWSSYSPSSLVQKVNMIPRIGWNFEMGVPSNFALSPSTLYTTNIYVQSLITFPAILLSIAIISFVIVITVMITRCFLQCGRCAPNLQDQYDKYEGNYLRWSRNIVTNRRTLLMFFWTGLLFALTGACVLFFGNSLYDPSLTTLQSDLNYVTSQYNIIQSISTGYLFKVANMYSSVNLSPCSMQNTSAVFESLKNIINLGSSSQSLYDATYPMPLRISQMNGIISNYAIQSKMIAMYTCFSFVTFLCLLSVCALCTRNKVITQVVAILQLITSAAITLVVCFQMVILMAWSDFCMNPVSR